MSDDDQMRSSRTPDGEPATPVHELTTSEGSSPTSSAPQDRSDAGTPAPDPPARRRRVTVPMAARRPRGTLGAAVVALGALVGVATLVTPTVTAAQTQPRPEAVASTELVCPVTTAS